MPREPIATTTFVAERIEAMTNVIATEVTSPYTFRVDRPGLTSADVLVFAFARVTDELLSPLLSSFSNVSFAVNVPKTGKWVKSAIALVIEKGIAFGGMGDLMSAISSGIEDIREFQRRENEFVERILRQHSVVSHIEQEADRLY